MKITNKKMIQPMIIGLIIDISITILLLIVFLFKIDDISPFSIFTPHSSFFIVGAILSLIFWVYVYGVKNTENNKTFKQIIKVISWAMLSILIVLFLLKLAISLLSLAYIITIPFMP